MHVCVPVCTRVCACTHDGVHMCVCLGSCELCVHLCTCAHMCLEYVGSACVHTHPRGDPRALSQHHVCASSLSRPPLPPFRSLDCKGSPGACTTAPCTRCQLHPNMQLPLLLPNPRLPNTSLRPSGTSTSPTSACQVRGAAAEAAGDRGAPSSSPLGGAVRAGGGQGAEGAHGQHRGTGPWLTKSLPRSWLILSPTWGQFYTSTHGAKRGMVTGQPPPSACPLQFITRPGDSWHVFTATLCVDCGYS